MQSAWLMELPLAAGTPGWWLWGMHGYRGAQVTLPKSSREALMSLKNSQQAAAAWSRLILPVPRTSTEAKAWEQAVWKLFLFRRYCSTLDPMACACFLAPSTYCTTESPSAMVVPLATARDREQQGQANAHLQAFQDRSRLTCCSDVW